VNGKNKNKLRRNPARISSNGFRFADKKIIIKNPTRNPNHPALEKVRRSEASKTRHAKNAPIVTILLGRFQQAKEIKIGKQKTRYGEKLLGFAKGPVTASSMLRLSLRNSKPRNFWVIAEIPTRIPLKKRT